MAPLALVALRAALFADVLTGERVLYERDLHLVVLGQVAALVRCVAEGAAPVWNPYSGFGQPMLANAGYQLLYPFTWLHLLVEPFAVLGFYAFAHCAIGAVGVYQLARHLGQSRVAAAVAGSVWLLSGPVLSLVNLWNHQAGAAYLPWALGATLKMLERPGRGPVLLCGLALAAQVLAGSPDFLLATLLGMLGCFVCARPAGRSRLAGATSMCGAGLVGLLVSAGQWLPTVYLVLRSERGIDSPLSSDWSMPPASWFQFVVAARIWDLPLAGSLRARLFDTLGPYLHSVYLGAGALGLVAAALVGAKRPWRTPLLVLGVTGIVVGFGRHTPVKALLLELVPALNAFRFPVKALVMTSLACSLLAGMGYDALVDDAGFGRRARNAARAVWGTLGAVALVAAIVTLSCSEQVAASFLGQDLRGLISSQILSPIGWRLLAEALILVVGLLALVVVERGTKPHTTVPLLLVCAVVGDLALAHFDLNDRVPRDTFARPPVVALASSQPFARVYSWDYRAFIAGRNYARPVRSGLLDDSDLPGQRFVNGARAQQALLAPFTGARWGIRGSFDRSVYATDSTWFAELAMLPRRAEETAALLPVLRLGSVDFVLALHSRGVEGLQLVATLPSPVRSPVLAYRVPEPLPRAYAVGGARVADGTAAFATLFSDGFDPRREVVLPKGPGRTAPPAFRGAVRILTARSERIVLEAELSDPGYVVMVDAYDPDWRVSVDGSPSALLRANVGFRAVPVPAGRHTIDQVYRPSGMSLGLALSALGIAVALGLGARGSPPPEAAVR